MIIVHVTKVSFLGSMALGVGEDDDETPVEFMGDARMMVDVAEEIEATGEAVEVTIEPWQIC